MEAIDLDVTNLHRWPPARWKPGWIKAPQSFNNINHQVLSSDNILCVPILDSICPQQHLSGKFLSQNVLISEQGQSKGYIYKARDPKEKQKMDRLLRLSGAGLGGMGGAQQPADAPVVDTAEQVWHLSF